MSSSPVVQCRTYVTGALDKHLDGKGSTIESRIYERVKAALPGQGGWDFYEFRKLYKRLAVRFLENLSYDNSTLKDALRRGIMSVEDALDLDHRLWEPNLWRELATDEVDDKEVVHEGLYPCGYCRSKKMYAMNTTDYAKQTRSADEPMTVFLHCHTCGKHYKFSS